MTLRQLLKFLLKGITAITILIVAVIGVLFLLLWQEHRTAIELPKSSGPYAVGRTTYTWVNSATADELSPSKQEKQTVVAWIWYPASQTPQSPRADYFPTSWQAPLAHHSGVLLTDFLTRDPNRVQVHSGIDAMVSPEQRSYPVVLMRAGAGAFTTDYTTVAEDLASHGYVVVGLDAPYRTVLVVLPDGRVAERATTANLDTTSNAETRRLAEKLLPMWTADIKFVLSRLEELNASITKNRFSGRLDLQHIGIFGHSFGGAQALQFCHEDARCKAAIDIDGIPFGSVIHDGLHKPGMFILSDHSHDPPDASSPQVLHDIQFIRETFPPGGLLITIRGANHFTFSDQILLKSHYLIGALTAARIFGRLEPHRGLNITANYVHAFFDVYLKGVQPSDLTDLSSQYPEVEVR